MQTCQASALPTGNRGKYRFANHKYKGYFTFLLTRVKQILYGSTPVTGLIEQILTSNEISIKAPNNNLNATWLPRIETGEENTADGDTKRPLQGS